MVPPGLTVIDGAREPNSSDRASTAESRAIRVAGMHHTQGVTTHTGGTVTRTNPEELQQRRSRSHRAWRACNELVADYRRRQEDKS